MALATATRGAATVVDGCNTCANNYCDARVGYDALCAKRGFAGNLRRLSAEGRTLIVLCSQARALEATLKKGAAWRVCVLLPERRDGGELRKSIATGTNL